MSFSKQVRHYRRSIPIIARNFQTESSSSQLDKMAAKTINMTQWKVVVQLKDLVSKVSNEKHSNSVMNKELANFLQKCHPSMYGKDLIKNFDSVATSIKNDDVVEKSTVLKDKPAKDQGIKIPNVLTGLGLKIINKTAESEKPSENVPKWKTKQQNKIIAQSSISTSIRHIISLIEIADTESLQLSRINVLSAHLSKYPEAKNEAVKEGAVRILLRLQEKSHNINLQAVINEVFALLGYVNPLPRWGIRILSIDGGGVRGILVIELLKKLEELTGLKVYEMFDYICGVSTGAILTSALATDRKSLSDMSNVYKEIGAKIFTQSPWEGTRSLVWSHSYYDTPLWEKLLRDFLGDIRLIETARNSKCPKFSTVSTVVNQSRISAFVFRNYALPYKVQSQYIGSSDCAVWEAVRASAAAPTYFEEFKLHGLLHQDGGVMVNNPTAVAIHEAKQLWPNAPIQCVVSFGTGRTHPIPIDQDEPLSKGNNTSWTDKFKKILDSATDTEAVHTMLNDLLPPKVYYRFNPYLTEMLSMVEIRPEKIAQMERDATMYLRRNEDKFQEAAEALKTPKTTNQKIGDWIERKQLIYGIKKTP